jgi:hypothetical protein
MLVRENAIKNYQFVTIQVNQINQVNRIYFPDLPNLRDVYTTSIVVYNIGSFAKDMNNVSPVSVNNFQKCYLTINVDGIEKIQNLDLRYLSPLSVNTLSFNPGGVLPMQPIKIDFQKSYVNIASGQNTGGTVPFSFCFGIYYYYPNKEK